ncbi:ATP-binding protein [Streptomyces violaceusniger]|uniref:ATP-binding protein n=1 Tax=Streptomyces violaceusniger TaxID=68280 RepID=UPI0036AFC704
MRETEFAAELLSAMISSRPLHGSPAGQALHTLVRARSDPRGTLVRQWEEASRAEDPLPALLQLANSLARYAATDPAWQADLEIWLQHHQSPSGETHNSIGGSAHLHGPTLQTGAIHGGVHFHHTGHAASRPAQVVPRQLRSVPAHFTNRREELSTLHGIASSRQKTGAPALAVICGPGGVGKTALALRWLHEVADQYPDGQLYADLAADSSGEPVLTGAVLGGFLRAMGIPGEQIPAEADQAAGLFRSTTAGRRIAILMDNAVSAAQVRALLPSTPLSTVVVTSRWRLGGLTMDGATYLPLTPMRGKAGRELLKRTVGEQRVAAEAEAAAGLVYLCAGLPIALSIAGARLVMRPEWPIARVVRELSDEQRRLKALSVEEATVMSVFDLSYDGLPPNAARVYRLLGLHPGPDISLEAAAAAVHLPVDDTATLMEGLVDASILETGEDDRYRFHDLIRLHARQRAEAEDSSSDRSEVIHRLLEFYLSFTAAADRIITPLDWHLGPAHPPQDRPPAFATRHEALEALERELPNLMAVMRAGYEHGCDTLVWQLAEAMWSMFLHRKHFPDWMAAYQLGIDATTRCADHAARSRMHHHLGFAFHNLSRAEEALQQGFASLTAAREAGHELAQAEALGLVGMAYRSQGRFDEAIEAQQQAIALDRRAGRVRSEALGRRRLGQALCAAGRIEEAIDQLTQGRNLAASLSDNLVKAMTTVWLADALTRAGRLREAVAMAQEAWSTLAESGSSQYRAQALMVWGEAAEELQDLVTARDRLRQSRAFYLEAGVPNLDRIDHALNRVQAQLDDGFDHSPP